MVHKAEDACDVLSHAERQELLNILVRSQIHILDITAWILDFLEFVGQRREFLVKLNTWKLIMHIFQALLI